MLPRLSKAWNPPSDKYMAETKHDVMAAGLAGTT